MGGFEITETGASSSTQGTTGRKPKPRQAENQTIIIEFSSLPRNLRTEKVRLFYDKDDSGFLESNNANGQNEIALMQEAFGLDLSKYKSNISTTKSYKVINKDIYIAELDDNDNERNKKYPKMTVTTGFDASGKKVVKLSFYKKEDLEKVGMSGNLSIDECHYQSGKLAEITRYNKDFKPYENFKLENGKFVAQLFLKNGYSKSEGKAVTFTEKCDALTWSEEKHCLYNNNGDVILELDKDKCYKKDNVTTLVKGKNTLQKHDIETMQLLTIIFNNDFSTTIEDMLKENAKKIKQETSYTFNGRPVQVKQIGKGRYEITDEKGNISYLSHDGVLLKPEYVRKNP